MFLCPPAPPTSSPAEAAYYPPPPPPQGGLGPPQQQMGTAGAPGGGRGGAANGAVPASGVSFYDVASYATLAQFTSGELRFYPSFTRQQHGAKLTAEIDRVLSRVTGLATTQFALLLLFLFCMWFHMGIRPLHNLLRRPQGQQAEPCRAFKGEGPLR